MANTLNDLSKTHPALLMRTCEAWLSDASIERRALVEHALRGAVKRGSPEALRLLGFGRKAAVAVDAVEIGPTRVAIRGRVAIAFTLRSQSRTAQDLLVDLAVHFVKANGRSAPKVFKLKRVTMPAGGRKRFTTSVSLAVHTTRKPYPGRHAVDVVVNGQATPLGGFAVTGNKP